MLEREPRGDCLFISLSLTVSPLLVDFFLEKKL